MLLELRDVWRSFGGVTAVKGVDLAVEQGEIVGLIGPNGAGKTTLFNLITGTHLPNKGRVLFAGEDVTRLSPDARCRRGIARTFQIVRPFPNLSVLDNVAVGAAYGHVRVPSRSVAEGHALDILEMLGLANRPHISAKHLTLVDRK